MVADFDMAAERGVVGEDDVVADFAVMRDVAGDHEQAVIADGGEQTPALGAGIHRHVFAYNIVIADS